MPEEKEGADLPQSHREHRGKVTGAGKKLRAAIGDDAGGKGLNGLAGYFM